MLSDFKTQLQFQFEQSLKDAFPAYCDALPSVELEIPADKQHGEFSANVALKSSKLFKKSPMDVAGEFLPIFQGASFLPGGQEPLPIFFRPRSL